SAALRDTTPPRLYFEAPLRLAEGDDAAVFISADEPVTYVVTYGDTRLEEVDQDHTFTLGVLAGDNVVTILATDGSGNRTEVSSSIEGVAAPEVELLAPPAVRSGDALGASVVVSDNGAAIAALDIDLEGESGPTVEREGTAYAVFSTPLIV